MAKITIDGHELDVPEGVTILQACEIAAKEIPVFCYHPKLSIAGNCRMCLVEVERSPKLVASCAMPVNEGMVIHTESEKVKKARKGNLELLLINHPLDCPICDQGGECDLQDITVAYGGSTSRYDLNKRAVPNKDIGPLVQTSMNRCIHCTRCVRFATEVAGVQELGAIGRGEHVEIGPYLEGAMTSELSGNIIDLCPVGALTSKPYAFKGRPWELSHAPSIDVLDAVGSAIRIDSRGREVMRILPRPNDEVNEDWISDKARFSCDGLKYQRLDTPYVRNAKGQLETASWEKAFDVISTRIKQTSPHKIAALAGNLVDVESMMVLKDLLDGLGSPHRDCRTDGSQLGHEARCSYVFNTTIEGIEQADFCLIIGSNPRQEAPLVNARLRKGYVHHSLEIALVGDPVDLGYPYDYLGNSPQILEAILSGKHAVSKKLKAAKHPMIIVGSHVTTRTDGLAILNACYEISEKFGLIHGASTRDRWNGFNMLHHQASRVGGLDVGFVPATGGYGAREILERAASGDIEVLYLLNEDSIDTSKLATTFVIYQGHHGEEGAQCADVVLPGSAYTEKSGTYVNTEGRVQRTLQAVSPPGEAKEDWKIITALSLRLDAPLHYKTIEDVRDRMTSMNPLFESVDMATFSLWKPFGEKGELSADPFLNPIHNYYMTDVISRHSPTMATCTQSLGIGSTMKRTGTHD